MDKKKIGVLLSGCGVFDGTEIHESVLTLLFIDQAGAEAVCFAPDIDQAHVINHLTQQEEKETRNVLVESARIARGEIQSINDVDVAKLDAVILPGGFGAAKNLSEFAFKGPQGEVNKDVAALLEKVIEAKKPLGALCIAPATVGMALKDKSPELTIGCEEGIIGALESIGVKHALCKVDEIAVDEKNRIVTSPAYMIGPGIADVAKGIKKLVEKVIEMTQ
ncbi:MULTISPECIES: isoprenoid biosynthesis glyoxalase ElbB [Desulfobacula]|uniref:DJ-1/PfpI family protein n=2 Tax=Desulfobacula TaxID=28222 RepID=K0N3H6_DESTT|nr:MULTISPECIES: isoprenoid biosynthesis glyoxalase ElbB [Desulfobacula]CCK78669.1 DJ-1/PfpI family protein [Desulfobacula toluolica Tol2]SDT88339.1 Enhancing lycopene biosynthesis protein 2 [Desulfobacula phenolica]